MAYEENLKWRFYETLDRDEEKDFLLKKNDEFLVFLKKFQIKKILFIELSFSRHFEIVNIVKIKRIFIKDIAENIHKNEVFP